jgi:hypothetical protein
MPSNRAEASSRLTRAPSASSEVRSDAEIALPHGDVAADRSRRERQSPGGLGEAAMRGAAHEQWSRNWRDGGVLIHSLRARRIAEPTQRGYCRARRRGWKGLRSGGERSKKHWLTRLRFIPSLRPSRTETNLKTRASTGAGHAASPPPLPQRVRQTIYGHQDMAERETPLAPRPAIRSHPRGALMATHLARTEKIRNVLTLLPSTTRTAHGNYRLICITL